MSNEIEQIKPAEVKPVTEQELIMHLENLGLLKDLTAGEKNTYLQIAKAFNLNPFKREIHVSKYNGQMSIITGYEVYIKRAERSGQLDGWEVECAGEVKDGSLKAKITIWRKDRSKPFTWEAKYSEYVQMVTDKNNGQTRPNKFWQKAETMIKKVAIAQGFRLCFNDELGGMPYTTDEYHTEDVPAEITTKVESAAPSKSKLSDKAFASLIKKIGECKTIESLAELQNKTTETCELTEIQAKYFVEKVTEISEKINNTEPETLPA